MTHRDMTPGFSDKSPKSELERAIDVGGYDLIAMAQPGVPLTLDRIADINPMFLEEVQETIAMGLPWPDETSAVYPAENSRILTLTGEHADQNFLGPILVRGTEAYNNFPAILRSTPSRPGSDEDPRDFYSRVGGSAYGFGTKPYLFRAYALQPEFMCALQEAIIFRGATLEEWTRVVQAGALDSAVNKEEAAILRGSRIAYTLLANLMRADDPVTQASWLQTSGKITPITDPEVELWT